ncbi:MAG: acyl-CoA thioesterase-1 [Candidatus Promineifilaceae bacterium]
MKGLNFRLFRLLILMGLLLLIGCASAEGEPVPDPIAEPVSQNDGEKLIQILAFGDSITAGLGVDTDMAYPAQLERKLLADGYKVEVTNGGISGETTSAALTRLDWMIRTEPDIVIINTGGNDGLRVIDLDLTRENFDKIVSGFDESGAVVVVAGMQIAQNLGEEYTTEFAGIYPAVAEKYGTILFPFFLEGVAADPQYNQADFIHPTAEGYTIIVDNIYPFILQAVEQYQNKQ